MSIRSKAADHMKKSRSAKGLAKDQPLWSEVKNRLDLGQEVKRGQEQVWAVTQAFIAGRQYTYFNTHAHEIKQLRPVRGRIRKVDNQLWPRVRRQISDFIKNDPVMSVVPATYEDEDIKAAKVGDKVIKAFWRNNELARKRRLLAGWIFSTGNCFIDHRWNQQLGPITVGEDGKVRYQGDADCGIWSPYEIFVPSLHHGDCDLHSFPWMIKAKWRTLEWITAQGPKGKLVVEETMPTPFMDNSMLFGGSRYTSADMPGALFLEMYLQPTPGGEFPNGLFIRAANGIVIEEADWPFMRYSMEHFKDIDIPGAFWGKATATDGIALQKTWNKAVSDIEEFNRTSAKGKFLRPRGSKMLISPDDTHGEIIDYKPVMGHKPELLTLKGLPATYQLVLDITQSSLNNLFSQHEVTQGTNKSDLRSGTMVGMLREQDAHGQIPAHTHYEEGMGRLMGGVLKRIQAGYEQGRMLQVVGRDDEFEVMMFKGSDLRNNTDVMVKGQSTVPDSRIARNAETIERYQAGLYGPVEDPEVRRHVMNMLDDAVVKDIYSEDIGDEKTARWENRMLLQTPVPVNEYDNHAIHLTELNLFRKRMDYQRLKVEDPERFGEVEARFIAHAIPHQDALARAREARIEEELMLSGKGGQG